MKAKLTVAVAALFCQQAFAADFLAIPKESGWSGFAGAGIGYYELQSNFVAGNGLRDLGDRNGDGLNAAPETTGDWWPQPVVDLRYTFGDSGTQLFLGNLIQDQVRLDWTQQLGVRQRVGDWGIVGLSALFSTVPTKVWDDPYNLGERGRTDRDSRGVRLSWDGIAGSTVGANYSFRKIDVDNDIAGDSLILTSRISDDETHLLERDGNNHYLELYARWQLSQRQQLIPAISYNIRDRDGGAEKGDGKGFQVTYVFISKAYSFTTTGYVGSRDYDEDNPVYDRKADADEYGINAIGFWHNPLGFENWEARFSLTYVESDSDIRFYDSSLYGGGISLVYKFR